MHRMLPDVLLLVVLSVAAPPCFSQTNPNLQSYFKDYIGLSDDQIAAIRTGQAVAKTCATGVEPAYVITEKQLYSSHYFETALDLAFCIRENANSKQPGFYLIMAMGSEQAGLTGFKGSIVRKVAVDLSASSLQKSLTAIKTALEKEQQ